MIQIETVEIVELRGIRKLTIEMGRKTFVICGPNGSGKSGVVDAIEFALTGEMARLMGKGTGGITLATHGPHVDKRDYPDASFVKLTVHIPSLGKSASITRSVKKPKDVTVVPDEADVRAVFSEVAGHPEVTLSRREIIKLILTEATQRSRDVQTLLKLDEIDQTRGLLKTTQNKLGSEQTAAAATLAAADASLCRHLDLPKLSADEVLRVVGTRRALLGLSTIAKLEADSSVAAGIVESAKTASAINKASALRDVEALQRGLEPGVGSASDADVSELVAGLDQLQSNPRLLEMIQRRSFIETGLDLVDSAQCPLCDSEWDIEALREHLRAKLQESANAETLQGSLLSKGELIKKDAVTLGGVIAQVQQVARATESHALTKILDESTADLTALREKLTSVTDLLSIKGRLETGWVAEPAALRGEVEQLADTLRALPDESETVEARTFLVVAQERLEALRRAQRDEQAAKRAADAGRAAYKAYCEVAERKLSDLYGKVEGEFCEYYRAINGDDEGGFTAKLSPENGKLDLMVDFYNRGMFPPGAYHSEGHQDGMGVCLYLALMKRLLADRFTFAVLDDVVMSVDAGHRRQFCKLLKARFPDTQFVITTHDKVWAKQMQSEGLVTAKGTMAFHSWSVDAGPIVQESREIWEEIEGAITEGRVSDASAALRRHLEFCGSELADAFGARVPYRPDGNHELGDLLPAALSRHLELLGKAAKSAQDWGNDSAKQLVKERKDTLSTHAKESDVERWAVNAAVHYNAWENFAPEDFRPVAAAFKVLLENFRCASCNSWLRVSPARGTPELLVCPCNSICLNLKPK